MCTGSSKSSVCVSECTCTSRRADLVLFSEAEVSLSTLTSQNLLPHLSVMAAWTRLYLVWTGREKGREEGEEREGRRRKEGGKENRKDEWERERGVMMVKTYACSEATCRAPIQGGLTMRYPLGQLSLEDTNTRSVTGSSISGSTRVLSMLVLEWRALTCTCNKTLTRLKGVTGLRIGRLQYAHPTDTWRHT